MAAWRLLNGTSLGGPSSRRNRHPVLAWRRVSATLTSNQRVQGPKRLGPHAAAAKGADINFPPFGKLKLDPGTMFVYGIKKATSGLDGIATFDVPIPNDPKFLGIMIHWQAINVVTVSKRPLLTNVLITTVKK